MVYGNFLLKNKKVNVLLVLQKLSFDFIKNTEFFITPRALFSLQQGVEFIFLSSRNFAAQFFPNFLLVRHLVVLPLLSLFSYYFCYRRMSGGYVFYFINKNRSERLFIFSVLQYLKRGLDVLRLSLGLFWSAQLYLIGIGYKIYIYKNDLYLRLGFSRMLKLSIPTNIFAFVRSRNSILLVGSNLNYLNSFLSVLKRLRAFDFYKGKGLYGFNSFEFIRLKIGKKQQFF